MNFVSCPLCHDGKTALFFQWPESLGVREFHHCACCDLRFVPSPFHVKPSEERERYEQHHNDPGDARYRNFLEPVVRHLEPKLSRGASGLDFGAGPGPALATMLQEAGFSMKLYDKYFHPDPNVLNATYDFITCTETAEHLAAPGKELALLRNLLKPGGWLAVMTGRLRDWSEFPGWYYHRDPTHIAFYSEDTWHWIARESQWECEFREMNITLLRRAEL